MAPHDLNEWLKAANERFGLASVDHKARPVQAVSEYGVQFRQQMVFGSPLVNAIHDFFVKNGPLGAQQVGSLFTNAFFFDAHFWPLHVLISFGQTRQDPFSSLEEMPDSVKDRVKRSRPDHERLLLHWADCQDYAYGLDDLRSAELLVERASAFMRNGDAKFRGAVAQLTPNRPNTQAALDLGLAAEIFMKALLIQEHGLTDDQLRKGYGHRIERVADECFKLTGEAGFEQVSKNAAVYPKVAERYDGEPPSMEEAWSAVSMTTVTGACVVRRYADRGMRKQVWEHLAGAK